MTEQKIKNGFDTVVWSGGADSTLALTDKARNTTKAWPVHALTMVGHPQLAPIHLKNQRAAMRRYLVWAKKQGFHVIHRIIEVKFNVGVKEFGMYGNGGQAMVWLCHLAPYFQNNADVKFGYIRGDDFWHRRHQFEKAFRGLAGLDDSTWNLVFPLEWHTKVDVLKELTGFSVPNNCWWSCDESKKVGKPCGWCKKCKELKQVRAEIKASSKAVMKKITTTPKRKKRRR